MLHKKIKMACQSSTTHIAVENTQEPKILLDCTIKTTNHIIHTGNNIVMEQMIRQWNLDNIHCSGPFGYGNHRFCFPRLQIFYDL